MMMTIEEADYSNLFYKILKDGLIEEDHYQKSMPQGNIFYDKIMQNFNIQT